MCPVANGRCPPARAGGAGRGQPHLREGTTYLKTSTGFLFGLLATLPIGVLVAVQARINGALGRDLNDGVLAAVISFGTGLVLVALIVVGTPGGRRGTRRLGAAVRGGLLPVWWLAGGVGGALLVASQGLTVGTLGVAVFTVAVVAGQTASGLVVDRVGLGPAGPTPVTGTRVVGAGLAVVAVLVSVLDDLGRPGMLAYAALPVLAGAAIAWQSAVNGRLGVVARAALPPTLVNFVVGTLVLSAVGLVDVGVRGWPAALPTDPVLYLGGACGVVFVAAGVVIVRLVGVLLMGLGVVAGQLPGALALDLLYPADHPGVTISGLIGTGLTLVAVVIAAVGRRSPPSPAGGADRMDG